MDDPIHEDPTEIAQQIAAGATARGKALGTDFLIDIDRQRRCGRCSTGPVPATRCYSPARATSGGCWSATGGCPGTIAPPPNHSD